MCCSVQSYFSASLSRPKKLLSDLLAPSVHNNEGTQPWVHRLAHFPSWNEEKFQTPAEHRRHGCEGMCFWWWSWYLFHVYVHSNHLQKENQSHSSLLMFSETSYRKENLELSYKPSNLLPPTFFCPFRKWFFPGTDQQLSPNPIPPQLSVPLSCTTNICYVFIDG